MCQYLSLQMKRISASKDLNMEEEEDSIINMNDPFLEVKIPEDEPTIFQAIRYGDTVTMLRQLREGYYVNTKSPGELFRFFFLYLILLCLDPAIHSTHFGLWV